MLNYKHWCYYKNNGTALFIFFNQKNKPHVSGRETRYLQALLWVSGPRSVRVFTTKQGGRLGPGNQGGVGWRCVCLWPPWTRSVLEMTITAGWDGHTKPWVEAWPGHACWPTLLFHQCQDSRGKGWGPLSAGVGPFQCFHRELWYTSNLRTIDLQKFKYLT